MSETRRVSICGTSIAFLDTGGPRPPILLIHGNSSSTAAWSRQIGGPLAECWRLIALDLPGCGDSGRLASYCFSALRAIITGFARELGAEDAVFVGHSLGGHLLLEAAPHLARARGFAIMGTPPLGKPPCMAQAFLPAPELGSAFTAELSTEAVEAWARTMFASEHQVPAQIVADIRRTDPRLRSDMQHAVNELDYTDEIEIARLLAKPLAVLHGAADALINPGYFTGLELPTLWRGAVQRIEGAGHYAQLERPEMFDALLEAFAQSCG